MNSNDSNEMNKLLKKFITATKREIKKIKSLNTKVSLTNIEVEKLDKLKSDLKAFKEILKFNMKYPE